MGSIVVAAVGYPRLVRPRAPTAAATHPGGDAPVPVQPRTVVEPMTSTETRIHITVSPEFVALLKQAKAGQGHVQPGASDEDVLRAALELLIVQQEKRKASVPAKVTAASKTASCPTARPSMIPASTSCETSGEAPW